ncbi:MAG: F0F1 ATP synthase subunit delta [Akkermansia sp.]
MKISKDIQADARRLMKLCLNEDGSMNADSMRHVIATVSERKPRNYVALLFALRELVRLYDKRNTATITSAVELTPAQRETIIAKLSARHAGLQFCWQIDPSLIAGMTVQIGDNLTDSSVKSRIERIAQI